MTDAQENIDDLMVARVAQRGDSKGLLLFGWSLLTTVGFIALVVGAL